jgi:hypothetical protein
MIGGYLCCIMEDLNNGAAVFYWLRNVLLTYIGFFALGELQNRIFGENFTICFRSLLI